MPYLEILDLSQDVLVGVVEPLVEGDGPVRVGVHRGKVFLPLRKTSLTKSHCIFRTFYQSNCLFLPGNAY